MRRHWLTDTSISPAICLSDWGRGEITSPSCMKKRAPLISEETQGEIKGEDAGCRGEREIASPQFRCDEGHSVSTRRVQISVTLVWLRLEKQQPNKCGAAWNFPHMQFHRDAEQSSHAGSHIPFYDAKQNHVSKLHLTCYTINRKHCGFKCRDRTTSLLVSRSLWPIFSMQCVPEAPGESRCIRGSLERHACNLFARCFIQKDPTQFTWGSTCIIHMTRILPFVQQKKKA